MHLIGFDEPFGFSVVEAMACGTPVIAFDRGSMSELIDHGISGFLVNNTDEAVEAVALSASLDRAALREQTQKRFSREAMVEKYVGVYNKVCRRI